MAKPASAKSVTGDFWSPRTGYPGLDAAVALIRKSVQEYTGHEPPLNSNSAYFNDHGDRHIQAVLHHAKCATSNDFIKSVLVAEQSVLCAAIWLHDVGLFMHPAGEADEIVRAKHAERSAEFVFRLQTENRGTISPQLAELLAELCLAHRRNYELDDFAVGPKVPEAEMWGLRGGLIGAFLRVSDAADAGQWRTPVSVLDRWEETIPPASRQHWQAHALVHASSLDPRNAEIVFHLTAEADPADKLLAELVVATTEDIDSTRSTFIYHGGRPWAVRFEQGNRYISPGLVYAKGYK